MHTSKTKILAIATTAVMLFSASANAEFILMDWEEEGDQQIAYDDATEMEWLTLSNTLGMSLNEVLSETADGGLFDGWRLPTADEVQTMMENIYPDAAISDTNTTIIAESSTYTGGEDFNVDERDAWENALGFRYYTAYNGSDRYWAGYGLYLNDSDNAQALSSEDVLMAGYNYQKIDGSSANQYKYNTYLRVDYTYSGYSTGYTDVNHGVYLVTDNSMAPMAIASLTAGDVPLQGAFFTSLLLGGLLVRKIKLKNLNG
jgi:hypothetical protein